MVTTPFVAAKGSTVADSKSKSNKDEDKKNESVEVVPGPRSMVVEGNDLRGYLGVSPEYMNYANATEKPILTEAEAHLFTNLTDDEIDDTRSRDFVHEAEAPAVVEGGWDSGVAATRYATTEGVNYDPGQGYTHSQVFTDDEGEDGLTGEEKADIAQGVRSEEEIRAEKKKSNKPEGGEQTPAAPQRPKL